MRNRIGKDGVFYVRSTSTLFYFAGVFLRFPDFFVILKADLHARRKHKYKPGVNLDDASTREHVHFSCVCAVQVDTWLMIVIMLVLASYV